MKPRLHVLVAIVVIGMTAGCAGTSILYHKDKLTGFKFSFPVPGGATVGLQVGVMTTEQYTFPTNAPSFHHTSSESNHLFNASATNEVEFNTK